MMRNQAEAKGVALIVEVRPDLPEVMVDPNKIVWVLVNLLANAVRYTPVGGHVWLRGERLGDMIQLSVKDDGPGVPRKCNPGFSINLSGWIKGKRPAAVV